MSETLERVLELVKAGDFRVSEHGYDELAADGILVRDLVESAPAAIVVEDYPDFWKGPCVLVLQHDADRRPVHVVWGISRGEERPAVLVTAYRPDPSKWSQDYQRRAT